MLTYIIIIVESNYKALKEIMASKSGEHVMNEIKNIKTGEKIPKICVPLVAGTLGGLLHEAKLAESPDIDLVEWRADCFEEVLKADSLDAAFFALSTALSKPILFTVRTAEEGGNLNISHDDYFNLLHRIICAYKPNLVDIELSCGERNCRNLIAAAKDASVTTILSSHNFKYTPPCDDMLSILNHAVGLGCDIAKLAVMPLRPADVLELLAVSIRFSRENPGTQHIAVAMGDLGRISRISGGFSGSAITFASLDQASAPGQIPFREMRKILNLLNG